MSEEHIRSIILIRHPFPGNVRELQNVIERAVVLCRSDRIDLSCLPPELLDDQSVIASRQTNSASSPLVEAETAAILRTLQQYDGHRGKTAQALGIDKSTLWRRMKRLGVTYP